MPTTLPPTWRILVLLAGAVVFGGCEANKPPPVSEKPADSQAAAEPLPEIPPQTEPSLESEPAAGESELKVVPIPKTDEAATDSNSKDKPANETPDPDDEAAAPPADAAKTTESSRYEFRRFHDPNGIGKFYMGREIALVMGAPAAGWLERPEREKEEQSTKMIDSLGLKPGMIVADIGAGSGVLTLMMTDKVGENGKVVAVDIQQKMLDRLAKKLKERQVDNVELVLGTDKSPRLPKESIDLALMVDVYHEFAYPYEMMLEISKAMKPGGRVVFVEFRMEDPDVPIKPVHKMSEAQVKKEISQPEFGLKWKETIGVLPWQHVIIFEKPAEKKE
jgi:precorrin-6B methylase 2